MVSLGPTPCQPESLDSLPADRAVLALLERMPAKEREEILSLIVETYCLECGRHIDLDAICTCWKHR